ncbi:unnamed protein product [Orchesella dallaii]|uniref:Uncharacterized protein n=1 Tax=Orchesella dallaii TaxID=48710 RepID=A0ABP1QYC6_9HEXA
MLFIFVPLDLLLNNFECSFVWCEMAKANIKYSTIKLRRELALTIQQYNVDDSVLHNFIADIKKDLVHNDNGNSGLEAEGIVINDKEAATKNENKSCAATITLAHIELNDSSEVANDEGEEKKDEPFNNNPVDDSSEVANGEGEEKKDEPFNNNPVDEQVDTLPEDCVNDNHENLHEAEVDTGGHVPEDQIIDVQSKTLTPTTSTTSTEVRNTEFDLEEHIIVPSVSTHRLQISNQDQGREQETTKRKISTKDSEPQTKRRRKRWRVFQKVHSNGASPFSPESALSLAQKLLRSGIRKIEQINQMHICAKVKIEKWDEVLTRRYEQRNRIKKTQAEEDEMQETLERVDDELADLIINMESKVLECTFNLFTSKSLLHGAMFSIFPQFSFICRQEIAR